MQGRFFPRFLSVIIAWALVITSFPAQAMMEPARSASAIPDFVPKLTPPAELGFVADAYQSSRAGAPLVLYIQDLHANYEVQAKIAKLLEFYDARLGPEGYKVAVEGAEGPVWITEMGKLSDQAFKADVGDRLMQAAELTGPEYFAVVNGRPDLLWGVENERYHKANIDLFRSTFSGKEALGNTLEKLEKDIRAVQDAYYSRSMRKLEKKTHEFRQGGNDGAGYIGYLASAAQKSGIDLQAYPETARWTGRAPSSAYVNMDRLFTEQTTLLRETQMRLAKTEFQRGIVTIADDVNLLKRFVREQISPEEIRRRAPDLEKILGRVQNTLDASGLPYDKKNLAGLISTSLDFYAMALLRDKFLAENTLELMRGRVQASGLRPQSKNLGPEPLALGTAVLVAGGFHTPGITRILKERGASYVVVTPVITEEVKSRDVYNQRLMGQYASVPELMAQRMLPDGSNYFSRLRSQMGYWMARLEGVTGSVSGALDALRQVNISGPAFAHATAYPEPPARRRDPSSTYFSSQVNASGSAKKNPRAIVVLVSDDLFIRLQLRNAVKAVRDEGNDGIAHIEEVGNGIDALRALAHLAPSTETVPLFIIRAGMPGMDGMELTGHILDRHRTAKVIIRAEAARLGLLHRFRHPRHWSRVRVVRAGDADGLQETIKSFLAGGTDENLLKPPKSPSKLKRGIPLLTIFIAAFLTGVRVQAQALEGDGLSMPGALLSIPLGMDSSTLFLSVLLGGGLAAAFIIRSFTGKIVQLYQNKRARTASVRRLASSLASASRSLAVPIRFGIPSAQATAAALANRISPGEVAGERRGIARALSWQA
jgi:CheY-like chemotaxis protein